MTVTNRAFINAYRRDPAQPTGPAAGAHAPAIRARVAATAGIAAERVLTANRSALYQPLGQGDEQGLETPGGNPVAGVKKPLSSYLSGATRDEPAARSTEILHPGTVVASFQWPAVCRCILQQANVELDQAAATITENLEAGRSIFAVLGLFSGQGATTTTLCLGARLAREYRTVIVDANFCAPRIASWLEAVPTAGWEEVLKRGAPLADALIHATDDQFDVLALGPQKIHNALRLVGGLQAVVTAGVLRHAYDVALVDAGAFFNADSQPIVLELIRNMGVDAVIAVSAAGRADPRDLASLNTQLARSSCELVGLIENRAR